MPKREDIKKVLIIGSGPIIIGQACEFDYSGTQACKALRKLGYEIVLVNSNPATIMTDKETADRTYIEPLNVDRIEKIIDVERPDALLPNLGGQSGLNLCSELHKAGVLDKYNVKVIGVQVDAIERGEDRIAFKNEMDKLGIEMARSKPAYSLEEAKQIADELGYPVVVRPAYTMGGAGGGFVHNEEELLAVSERGLAASLVGQILVEESVLGWEELELEVVRDSTGKKITVCFIENIDPMGVHTGDSFCAAPMLTISKELQQRLQEAAYKIVDAIEVIGGTNVQFAHDPITDRIVVIEINPRTSRSSALASKATGFPIASVSTLLAAGLTLSEIECGKYGTLDKYVPDGEYVVIKFARWAFEKFKNSKDALGTQMKAVGEVMSIGRNYKEAFQKAIRSLEIGRYGLGFIKNLTDKSLEQLLDMLKFATSERQFIMYEALKKGATIEQLYNLTKIKHYFIEQMKELVDVENKLINASGNLDAELLKQAKLDGFSDKYISLLTGLLESTIRQMRKDAKIVQSYEKIHVSGTKDAAYYYSTYNTQSLHNVSSNKNKVLILGGGPNRIGQGIEFDYCCVHAAFTLKKLGIETIMVNCNPETVSTDYDTSDKLYFEPLTLEDVLSIYDLEKPLGVISQFGGQTPLNLATTLQKAGVTVLGTSPSSIDTAEDRDKFRAIMEDLKIPMPPSEMASTTSEALEAAKKLGYPLMVRPSFVLGGRGMEVVYNSENLIKYMEAAIGVTPESPILIDRFLDNALECEADAISDGENVFVPAIMEHIELAGVHSGDSACALPSLNISKEHIETINNYTERIAKALNVKGLMNMQYAISDGVVYVLEANPRASRTVPLVSKVCDINMVPIAVSVIMSETTGEPSPIPSLTHKHIPYYGVKEAVFPFNMFPEVDPVLGPEMRSTGEVLGLAHSFGQAFCKAQESVKMTLPTSGTIFISVSNPDKAQCAEVAKRFSALGFNILTTEGTGEFLTKNGIKNTIIKKLKEGEPNLLNYIAKKEIALIINSPSGHESTAQGSYIRKAAIKERLPYMTTMSAALAAVKGIEEIVKNPETSVFALQDYHLEIK